MGFDIQQTPVDEWKVTVYLRNTEYDRIFASKNIARDYLEDLIMQANNSLFVYLGE